MESIQKLLDEVSAIPGIINIIIYCLLVGIGIYGYYRFIYVKPSTVDRILENLGKLSRLIDCELHYIDEDKSALGAFESYGLLSERSKNLKRIIENCELVTIIRTTDDNEVVIKDKDGNIYEVPICSVQLLDSQSSK